MPYPSALSRRLRGVGEHLRARSVGLKLGPWCDDPGCPPALAPAPAPGAGTSFHAQRIPYLAHSPQPTRAHSLVFPPAQGCVCASHGPRCSKHRSCLRFCISMHVKKGTSTLPDNPIPFHLISSIQLHPGPALFCSDHCLLLCFSILSESRESGCDIPSFGATALDVKYSPLAVHGCTSSPRLPE